MKKQMRPAFANAPSIALAKLLSAVLLGAFLFLVSCAPSEPDPPEEIIPPVVDIDKFSPNAKRLMNYLTDRYGEKIISGQMDAAWDNEGTLDMIARVFKDTNKYPAIKGFDFIDLPNSWGGNGRNQVDEAIEWWDGKNNGEKLLTDKPNIHGIVTFCWHWRVTGQFYTNQTSFRIPWQDDQLDTESVAFQTIKSDLDKVAALLQLLKDKDIPVLWRPLHEASGRWFWWGASGAEPYIALWEYMYDYLFETKKLNNLIWVWNGQSADWFPNPDTVDIVGYDVYTNSASPQTAQNYDSQYNRFIQTRNMVPERNLMVAMSENGAFPDPDNCVKDNAMWSWFCTWNDSQRDNQLTGADNKDNFWSGEYHNTNAHKKHVYEHDRVITLDELPDLTAYRLE